MLFKLFCIFVCLKATKFYDGLATRAVKNGHALDVYSCALDQTGLCEMKSCFNATNGIFIFIIIETNGNLLFLQVIA